MLSKVVEAKNTQDLNVQEYILPSPEDVDQILKERKQEAKRRKIIDNHKDDPLKAAKKEANRIMVEAQEKLNEAQMEATALKSRQEKEIRETLTKEFQAKFEKSLKEAKQNYLNTSETLAKLKEVIYKQSEAELMDLVFSIAKKVIGEEIKTSPKVVIAMLEKGFEKIRDAKQYEIKVHPLDYQVLSTEKESLQEILKTSGSVKFTQDESVERGGCKIVTESGDISSEPGKQLDIIIKELSDGT
jgi:flagellar assembly protein FliH